MVSGIGILSTSKNPELSRSFIEFLLSPDSQRYFATETFEYPLLKGVPLASGVVPIEDINHPALAPSELTDLRGAQGLLREVGVLP